MIRVEFSVAVCRGKQKWAVTKEMLEITFPK